MARRPLHKMPPAPGRPAPAPPASSSRPTPAAWRAIPRSATIRRQYVRCGKCPKAHGPYWYAFWEERGGRTRSAYIGSDAALGRLLERWGGADRVDEDLDDELAGAPHARAGRGARA